jgi:hypothetical protein
VDFWPHAQAERTSPVKGGGVVSGAKSEEADNYGAIVARLNADWRVIVCSVGLQWVLQRGYRAKNHGDMRWRGRSFCRTSEALIRCSREHASAIEPAAAAILAALPARIDDPEPIPEEDRVERKRSAWKVTQ